MTTSADTRIAEASEVTAKPRGIWRRFIYSAIGIVVFFFPMTYQGKSSIPLDHMVTIIREYPGPVVPWFILALIVYDTAREIINRNWRNGPMAAVFTVADGTELAAARLQAVLTNDPGMGVIRHFDAGYDRAAEVAGERGVRVPMAFRSRES